MENQNEKRIYIVRGNSYKNENGQLVKATLFDNDKQQYYYLKPL